MSRARTKIDARCVACGNTVVAGDGINVRAQSWQPGYRAGGWGSRHEGHGGFGFKFICEPGKLLKEDRK